MNQWLRGFIQANPGREKTKAVFTSTLTISTKCKVLDLFNDLVMYCNGNGRSLIEIRLSALEEFVNNYDADHQKALFDFFCSYMPHWSCTQEFSHNNMKCFLRKLSESYIFLKLPVKISIHAPAFKLFRAKIEPEMTAATIIKGATCIIDPDKEAVRSNKFGINICKSCTISLGQALKKKLITVEMTKEDIISYLKKKREEKENQKYKKKLDVGRLGV